MNEVLDLIRTKDLIPLIIRTIKEKAGVLGAMITMFGDPVTPVVKRIEKVAAESGDVLSANKGRAQQALDASPSNPEAQAVYDALLKAEADYRTAERATITQLTTQLREFTTGRATAKTADVVTEQVTTVEKALTELKKANERARAVLEPAPRPIGPRPPARKP
jgi:hypothetical protein